jgi:hypothetical protein
MQCLLQTAYLLAYVVREANGFRAWGSTIQRCSDSRLLSSSQRWTMHARYRQDARSNTILFESTKCTEVNSSQLLPPSKLTLNQAVEEAEVLRQRARGLLEEVETMEAALKESRSRKANKKISEKMHMVDKLFLNRPLTPEAVARVMREERWSADQACLVLDALYDRLTQGSSTLSPAELKIGDHQTREGANHTEVLILESYIDCLIRGAENLDQAWSSPSESRHPRWSGRVASTLKSQLNERYRRDAENFQLRVAAGANDAVLNANETVQEYMRRTLGLPSLTEEMLGKSRNLTHVMNRISLIPVWIPSSLLQFVTRTRARISPADVKAIKNEVLVESRFFCTSFDSIPSAAIFRGNLRPPVGHTETRNLPAECFRAIQQKMDERGLSERVQLFLMPDPEWRPTRDVRDSKPKPVILAIPQDIDPSRPESVDWRRFALKCFAVGLSALTTYTYSVSCFALNPFFFESIVSRNDVSVLRVCLPVFVGVVAVQLVHELAHYFVAKQRDIKIGLPTTVPSTQLGTFGCVTPLKSFPTTREALLDFSLSGPVAAILMSIIMMSLGISATLNASAATISTFPTVPLTMLKSSLLTGILLSVLAPKVMMMPLPQPIPLHPIFFAGFVGLISSALNLLPIVRIDGGRACTAALGGRVGAFASIGTAMFLLSFLASGSSGLGLAFGLFVGIFQRRPEVPVRDEVTEVGRFRLGAWVVSVGIAAFSLMPFPGCSGIL